MKILSIETSCDETALALVEASGGLRAPRFQVIAGAMASQIKLHRPFGGVVPNLAKREHIHNLPILWKRIMNKELKIKNKNLKDKTGKSIISPSTSRLLSSVDLLAVTVGPGLEPALWTGIAFAKQLGKKLKNEKSKLKIVGVNHLEGHLYSFLLPPTTTRTKIRDKKQKVLFPAIGLIVSGGHTILILMRDLTHWTKLGETRDDAVGETFDKVARLLNLPYPGGPEIEKAARHGNGAAVAFPRPMLHNKSYDFSFSGLKTAVLYYLRAQNSVNAANIAASFQQAAVDVLVAKTGRAAKEFGGRSIMLSGGVAANKFLRYALGREAKRLGCRYFVPEFAYNTDNAAMIAAAAYLGWLRQKKYRLAANGSLNL